MSGKLKMTVVCHMPPPAFARAGGGVPAGVKFASAQENVLFATARVPPNGYPAYTMQPFWSLLFTPAPPETTPWPPTMIIPAKLSAEPAAGLFEIGTFAGAAAMPAFANGSVPTSNHPVAVTTAGLVLVCIELCVPYATTRLCGLPAALSPPAIENWKLNSVVQGKAAQLVLPPNPIPTEALAPPVGTAFAPAGGTTCVHPWKLVKVQKVPAGSAAVPAMSVPP